MAAGRDQLVVLAAERHDRRARAGRRPPRSTRSAASPAQLASRAARMLPTDGVHDDLRRRRDRRPVDAVDAAPQHDAAAARRDAPRPAPRTRPGSRRSPSTARAARPARRRGARSRPGPRRSSRDGLDAVGRGPLGQHVELGQLVGLGGHHDLAAPLATATSWRSHQAMQLVATVAAQLGLLRAGRVVEPGVDHPGVVPALVPGDGRLLVEHHDRAAAGRTAGWPGRSPGRRCRRRRRRRRPARAAGSEVVTAQGACGT